MDHWPTLVDEKIHMRRAVVLIRLNIDEAYSREEA